MKPKKKNKAKSNKTAKLRKKISVVKKNKKTAKKTIKKALRQAQGKLKKFVPKKAVIKGKKVMRRGQRQAKNRKSAALKPFVKNKRTIKKIKKKKKIVIKIKKSGLIKKVFAKHKLKALKQEADFSTGSFFKAKIKVIGIGGGGGSIVSEIGKSLHKAAFVIADTDARAFKKRQGIKYFLFGQKLTHGLGTGLDTDLAKKAAEQEIEKIKKLFEDQDIVIFVASLGGGLGSGATRIFAEAAKSFNGITFGIFTLPFKFEGKNKYRIAAKALHGLRESLNVSITIPNERIFKIIGQDTPIVEAFSMVNKNLIESLESLIGLIYNPGIINIDFADLRTILNGRGNMAYLNTAEASGKNGAEKITEEILNNPLYQNNNFTVEKILFNIAGGGNLSMFEVDKVSRKIAEKNPKAKIIFGISKNLKHKNRIKTTLLMTGPAIPGEKSVSRAKEKKIIKEKIKIKNQKSEKKIIKKKKITDMNPLMPVFNSVPVEAGISQIEHVGKKINIFPAELTNIKKPIRRNALEIKKDQEMEENKKSDQEKEWEIPAFMRKIHRIK